MNRNDRIRRLHMLAVLLLALAPCIVFQRALSWQFTAYDDPWNITENAHVSSFSLSNLKWMLTDIERSRRYLPLGWMAYAVDQHFFGLTPLSYHAGNLLLHILNTLLVYVLVRRLLEVAVGSPAFAAKPVAGILGPAVAALLWALNPLRVEPVAWCSARIYLVAATFFFSALLAYLRAARREREGQSGAGWRWLAFAAYLGSLLTYPVAIFGVAAFALLEVFPLCRMSLKAPWTAPRRIWMGLLPFGVIAIGLFAFMLWCNFTTVEKLVAPEQNSGSPLHKMMQAFYVWAYYVWKPLLPFNLSPQCPTFFSFKPLTAPFLASLAGVGGLTAWLWHRQRQWTAFWIAWLIHLVMLVPLLGITEVRYHHADRYDYIVGVLPFILVAGLIWKYWDRFSPSLIVAGAAALVTASAAISVNQLSIWRNPITLFEQFSHRAGGSPMRPYMDALLGGAYRDAGSNALAIATCRRALEAHPGLPLALRVLGDVHQAEGRLDEALGCYDEALRHEPQQIEVSVNRGVVLGKQGKLDQAKEVFRSVLRAAPDSITGRQNLAYVLQLQGVTNKTDLVLLGQTPSVDRAP